VLAPGGIAALSWWDSFKRNRINGIFHETISELGVSAPGVLPPGPPIDRFSDSERFAAFLRAAGFFGVTITQVSFTHHLPDTDGLWNLAMGSFARASALSAAQSSRMQRQIRAAVAEKTRAYAAPGGFAIPVAFLVASGLKR
jgi:hypothetical protein